jgi:hypothetical protein
MAFWDETGDAEGNTKGNYFNGEGEYDLEVEAVKHRNGYKGEAVIVNVKVLTSNRPDVPPGTSKDCAWNLTKNKAMALSNIKSFVCGIYGLDDNRKGGDVGEKVKAISKRMVEADNPLAGVKVHLSTFVVAGKVYTNLDWAPYKGEEGYVPPMPSAVASFAAPPPPPPPATNGSAAKAKAQATPGWTMPDGRWFDGTEWRAP